MAPLQGYTDRVYRNLFCRHFGGIEACYTPFIRLETGGLFRNRDLRDIDPEGNSAVNLIPQILPGSPEEFRLLAEKVAGYGYRQIDINMGCSFPMIAGRKKGAGVLPFPERVKEVLSCIHEFPSLEFSLKMRLGWEKASECMDLVETINGVRLCRVGIHARTGKQQYKGSTDPEAFGRFYEQCRHPLFYNGDLYSLADLNRIFEMFPLLRGVLLGRGLLSSPFMAKEFSCGEYLSEEERMKSFFLFHSDLYAAYKVVFQDEKQLLNKMKTFWDYWLPGADKKAHKQIKKSNRLSDYEGAVGKMWGSYEL